MSFLKKIFGATSFDEERNEGDELFSAGRYEDARLAYVRALDRKKNASGDAVAHCEERVAECLDKMAELRIDEAQRLADEGHLDLAENELRNAMETAASEEIAKRARVALETLEKEDARIAAETPEELSDDDRWSLLAGNWEAAQIDEYDEYGEEFREALLRLPEEVKEARATLEELIEEHEDEACYLWLEVGRVRILDDDLEEAEDALRTFVECLETDEGGEARLSAHAELAALRDRAGDEEGAIEMYKEALDAFPDDPRPFFLLGRYLRSKGYAEEAADVLEEGLPMLGEQRLDWSYFQELGLAKLAAGEDEEAAEYFDRVIAFFVAMRRPDQSIELPPATAVARAQIHEKHGALDKAADLFRTLANGSDRENHLNYHREAGRLLLSLELFEEARRMLTRALALAEDDPAARAEIEAQLSELE